MYLQTKLLFWLKISILGASIFLLASFFFPWSLSLIIAAWSLFYGLVRGSLMKDEDLTRDVTEQTDLLFEVFAAVAAFSIFLGLAVIFKWDKDHRNFRFPIINIKPRE